MAKVLVVDDRPTNRELLVTILGYGGHQVIEAADGSEALAALAPNGPDLIISDILMPSMDGYEFVRRLRAHPTAGTTPVVFCTAHYLSREASALASSCGVARILYKPIEPEAVLAVVADMLAACETPASVGGPCDAGFDNQHLRLVNDQLVEKARALERANGRLAMMLQFAIELGRERRLRPFLAGACQAARVLVGARYTVMAVLDDEGRARAHAVSGLAHTDDLDFSRPLAGRFAEMLGDGTPRNISSPLIEPDMLGLPPGLPPARSFLAVPFASAENVRGWIGFGDKLDRSSFDQEDEDVARMVAAKIGIILENTLLTQQLADHTAQLQAAHDQAKAAEADAKRANLAKSKFLAAASHDLRQPVQSLALLGALLKDKTKGTPLAAIVGPMEKALEALKTLLSSILDISKLDAGAATPVLRAFPVQDLLDRVAHECGVQAESKGLQLRMVPAPSLHVRTDPGWLERILRNLVENAVRYTAEGKILLGCRRRGDSVFLEVLDTGIGIPEEQMGNIFEEFYQVGNPARNTAKGLGLGLAIVRRLACLMDHKVHVQSTPGRGSRFAIELPATAPPVVVPEQATVIHSDFRRHQVLVIDDEDTVGLSLAMTLEGWGFRVVVADSGEAAVVKVREGSCRPDLVLTDLRLGAGMDGVEAIRLIRLSLGCAVAAAVLTGETAPERMTKLRSSGLPVLHKPIAAGTLRDTVERLLQGDEQDLVVGQ